MPPHRAHLRSDDRSAEPRSVSGAGTDAARGAGTGTGVYFSQGGIRGGGASPTASAAIIPVALLGGVGLSLVGFFALARFAWLPTSVRATVIAVIFLIVFGALFRFAARGYKRVMSALKMPMEMNAAARVNVICWPDQMERLQTMVPGPGDGGAFEPEACRVWFARRTSMAKRMQDPKFAKRWLASIILLPIVLNVTIHSAAHRFIDPAIVMGVFAAALMVPIAWGFVRPTFLRVSPGRIDIVRFGFLGGTPKIESFSLRDAPVRLDLRRKELMIGGWHPSHPEPEPQPEPETGPEPESPAPTTQRKTTELSPHHKDPQAALGSPAQIAALVIIPLWATTELRTLEDAVFRAAIATADAGPLPDDRLIG